MGQKIQPHGLRLGITSEWRSRWYADKQYADYLAEDIKIREFLSKGLDRAGIADLAAALAVPVAYAQDTSTTTTETTTVQEDTNNPNNEDKATDWGWLGLAGLLLARPRRYTPEMVAEMAKEGRPPSHETRATFAELSPQRRLVVRNVIDFLLYTLAFALLAVAVAFLSASQDVVIDAWRTDVLDPAHRGLGASLTVLGYRLAIAAGSRAGQ